jgi:hypothetical protein
MRVLNRNRMLTIRPTIKDGVNFIKKLLMLKYPGCRRCLVKGFRNTGVGGGLTDRRKRRKFVTVICTRQMCKKEHRRIISNTFQKIVPSNIAGGRYFEHLLRLS